MNTQLTKFYFLMILIAIIVLVYLFDKSVNKPMEKEKFQYNTKLDCGINVNSVNTDCPNFCSSKHTDTDLNNNVYTYCLDKLTDKLPEKDIGKYFFDDKISDGITCPDSSYKDRIILKGQNSVYSVCKKNN